MDQIALLTKFRDELLTCSEFSEINYETTFVSLFERIFGKNDRFTCKARHIASGIGVKGVADVAYGSITDEQFNHNKHDAFLTRLCARIGHLVMQKNGTAPHDNAGGCLPDRKAKADTGTQHGRNAVSCPKAIGHD